MAANERKPGPNLGRSSTDWEAAFACYASLPPRQRCYQAVADEFGVSIRTVEKQGRNRHWKQRLRAINAETAAKTNDAISQARADHLSNLGKLVEATLIGYADKLRRGEMRISPADLERLHKLRQQLDDEITGLTGSLQSQRPTPAAPRAGEHTAAVIDALRESG